MVSGVLLFFLLNLKGQNWNYTKCSTAKHQLRNEACDEQKTEGSIKQNKEILGGNNSSELEQAGKL